VEKMKKLFKTSALLGLIFCFVVLIIGLFTSLNLPSQWKTTENSETVEINNIFPLRLDFVSPEGNSVEIYKNDGKHYNTHLKLFNLIPIKDVNINLVNKKQVVPCGTPFGIKIFTEGVVVIGTSNIKINGTNVNPARDAGLKRGDVITKINGKDVNSNEDISNMVENSAGGTLDISVRRNNIIFSTKLLPCKTTETGQYKAGVWVRDSSAGIGTMTFFDPESKFFVGLGHGICDIDTGDLLPLKHGEIVKATINGVNKGEKGKIGELRGYFNNEHIGNLYANVNSGIYGRAKQNYTDNEAIPIAMKQQVKRGPAKIISTIDEHTQRYFDVEIKEVNYHEDYPTKNIIIEITDENLVNQTGGIVQGMSGSPIIQNGMIVGAITHVFVNDPCKGYAIFAENMLEKLNSIYNFINKKAS
jgi:stage IV sporulation protein B